MTSWQDIPSDVHSFYKTPGEKMKNAHNKIMEEREASEKRTRLHNLEINRRFLEPKKPATKRRSIFREGLNFARISLVSGLTSLLLSPQNYDVPGIAGYQEFISKAPSYVSNFGTALANKIDEVELKNFRNQPQSMSAIQFNLDDLGESVFGYVPEENQNLRKSESLYQIISENKKIEVLKKMEEIVEEQRTINPIFDLNEYQDLFSQKEISLQEIDNAKILSRKLLDEPLDAIADIAKARADYIKGSASSRAGLVRSLERYKPFIPTVKSIFKEHDVPEELVYLALVESNFVHDAESYAGAVGAWQFKPETGKRNGLVIEDIEIEEDEFEDSKSIRTYTLDERLNPILAAEATAKELSYLHKIFGDWCLATAAYNIGERGVQKRLLEKEKTCENLYLAFGEELERYDRSVRAWYKQGHPRVNEEELESVKVRTPRKNPNHRERITYFPELLARIEAMKEIDSETLYKPASGGHFEIVTINQKREYHQIKAGETVWDVSKKFAPNSSQIGTELLMGRIARASGIENMDKVRVGQKLNIPPTPRNLYEFSIMNGYNPDYMGALNQHIELHSRFPEKIRIVTYHIPEKEIKDAVTKL